MRKGEGIMTIDRGLGLAVKRKKKREKNGVGESTIIG